MNNKEKAEAYVRQQLPELMELSFGCELIAHNRLFTYITPRLGGDNRAHVRDDRNGMDAIYRDDITEIIGHPIQLQHWLKVLRKFGLYYMSSGMELHRKIRGGFEKVCHFNDEGQPATEADYQAFNDIVGI